MDEPRTREGTDPLQWAMAIVFAIAWIAFCVAWSDVKAGGWEEDPDRLYDSWLQQHSHRAPVEEWSGAN